MVLYGNCLLNLLTKIAPGFIPKGLRRGRQVTLFFSDTEGHGIDTVFCHSRESGNPFFAVETCLSFSTAPLFLFISDVKAYNVSTGIVETL